MINYGGIQYREDQVMRLEPLCEGLTSLGWKPRVLINDGLDQTISWFLGNETSNLFLDYKKVIKFNLPVRM